jgi:hypothetical protein
MTATPLTKDSSTPRSAATLTRLLLLTTLWLAIVIVSACLFRVGIQLRHWAWTNTENLHFQSDVTHAYGWGTDADQNGLLSLYRQIRADYGDTPDLDHGLDYAPLRLTIMKFWAHWVNQHFSPEDEWDTTKSYAFHKPLLMINAACEAAAAVGVVLVLRLMRRIAYPGADPSSTLRGVLREYLPLVIAALLVWFNPGLILNDCWPQWDAWILPSFIFALYFSMRGWWFVAGLCLGLGAMLKGQILFVTPVFVLWPLFSGQWLGVGRVVTGIVVAFTLIAVPWTLTSHGDIAFASSGAILAAFILIYRQGWRRPLFQFMAAAALVIPVWLTPKILSGDLSWLVLPYTYGPIKHPQLGAWGTSNLATLLGEKWGWQAHGPDGTIELPLPHGQTYELALRALLTTLYAISLIACGLAAGLQWRRRSQRFLLAMYTPWVLFFSLLPYLNQRYLLWAACFFPLLIPLGLGMTLLGALLVGACCVMLLDILCWFNSDTSSNLSLVTHGTYPDMAFMILLIAAIFLFNALVLSPKPKQAQPG